MTMWTSYWEWVGVCVVVRCLLGAGRSLGALSTPSIDESGVSHTLNSRFNSTNSEKGPEHLGRIFDATSWQKKPWYSDARCFRPALKCSEIESGFRCLGAPLHHTKIIGTASPLSAQKYAHFSGLPKCWTVLRELVCAVSYPLCHDLEITKKTRESRALLVSKHLCDKAWRDCQILIDHNLWPEELRLCQNRSIYTDKCNAKTGLPPLQWNKSETCMWPLVKSEFKPGLVMDDCALNCTSPWLTEADHRSIRRWLPVVVLPMILACIFSVISSYVSWKKYDRSLDALFWCITCYAIISICWMLQLLGLREKLMCLQDGSIRLQEPGNNAGLTTCTTQFSFLYGSIFGCAGWLVVYCYCQYKYFTDTKGISKVKWSLCHLVSWAPSIIINVAAMVLWKVESDGISGICFLTTSDPRWTSGLLYGPLAVYLLLSWLLVIIGVLSRPLRKVTSCCGKQSEESSESESDEKKKPKLDTVIFRLIKRKKSGEPQKDSETSRDSLEENTLNVEEKFQPEETSKLVSLLFVISVCYAASLALHLAQVTAVQSKGENLMRFLLCELNKTSVESGDTFYGLVGGDEKGKCALDGSPDARLLHLHVLLIQFLPCAVLNFYFWACKGVLSGYQRFWLWVKKKLYCAKLSSKRVTNQNGSAVRDIQANGLELTSLKSNVMSSSEDASDPEGGGRPGVLPGDRRDKPSKRRKITRLDGGGSRVSHRRSLSGGSKTPSGNSLASTSLPSELRGSWRGSESSLSFADLKMNPVIPQPMYNRILERGYTMGFIQGSAWNPQGWNPMMYPPQGGAGVHPHLFTPAPVVPLSTLHPSAVPPPTSAHLPPSAGKANTENGQGGAHSGIQHNPSAGSGGNFVNGMSYDLLMQQYIAYLATLSAGTQPPEPSRQPTNGTEEGKRTGRTTETDSEPLPEEVQNASTEEAGNPSISALKSEGLLEGKSEELEEEEVESEEEVEDEDEEEFDDSMSDSEEEEDVNRQMEKYRYGLLTDPVENGEGEREGLLQKGEDSGES